MNVFNNYVSFTKSSVFLGNGEEASLQTSSQISISPKKSK